MTKRKRKQNVNALALLEGLAIGIWTYFSLTYVEPYMRAFAYPWETWMFLHFIVTVGFSAIIAWYVVKH